MAGFRRIEVTDADHPFVAHWWPRHSLGWDQIFVHEIACPLDAIAGEGGVAPQLLKYCERDTLAMVELRKALSAKTQA